MAFPPGELHTAHRPETIVGANRLARLHSTDSPGQSKAQSRVGGGHPLAPPPSDPSIGVLAAGNFNTSALLGSLAGKTLADFVILLQSGWAYVSMDTSMDTARRVPMGRSGARSRNRDNEHY